MKTIGEVIRLSSEFLAQRKVPLARRTSEEILSHVLKLKKMELYLQFDKPIVEKELKIIREMVKRCAQNEPVDYVLGEIEFFGCKIKTDSRALIPRPETEILVEMISKKVKGGTLWDLCTGSGCIGIALKKANPELRVTMSDLSKDALTLAFENAQANKVDVRLLQGDLLAPFLGEKADCIVCNPPYISACAYEALDPSVKEFEPKLALLGGENGTEIYERLAKELPLYLNEGGQVFFEIGFNQGAVLKELFPTGTLLPDWAGHDRFFFLESWAFL